MTLRAAALRQVSVALPLQMLGGLVIGLLLAVAGLALPATASTPCFRAYSGPNRRN